MNKSHKYFLGLYYRIFDLLTLNAAFFIAALIRFKKEDGFSFVESNYFPLLIFINLSWIVLSQSQKIYNVFLFASRKRYFFRVALVVTIQLIITIGFNGLLKTLYSRLFVFYTFIGFGTLMFLGRLLINSFYKAYIFKKSKKNTLLFVGSGFSMKDVESFLVENGVDNDLQKVELLEDSQNLISQIERLMEESPISEIYINLSEVNSDLMDVLLSYCDNNFIRLRLVLDWQKLSSKQVETRQFSHTTVLNIPLTWKSPLLTPIFPLKK